MPSFADLDGDGDFDVVVGEIQRKRSTILRTPALALRSSPIATAHDRSCRRSSSNGGGDNASIKPPPITRPRRPRLSWRATSMPELRSRYFENVGQCSTSAKFHDRRDERRSGRDRRSGLRGAWSTRPSAMPATRSSSTARRAIPCSPASDLRVHRRHRERRRRQSAGRRPVLLFAAITTCGTPTSMPTRTFNASAGSEGRDPSAFFDTSLYLSPIRT